MDNIFDHCIEEARKKGICESGAMTVSQICDEVGRLIGMLEEDTYEIRIKSNVGKFLGKYTKYDNRTYDAVGKLLSTGNTLAMLLRP